MGLLNEIEYLSPEIQRLERYINSYTTRVQQIEQQIKDFGESYEKHQALRDEVQSYFNTHVADMPPAVRESLSNTINAWEGNMDNDQYQQERRTTELENTYTALNKQKEQLEKIGRDPVIFTKESVREALKNVGTIEPRSVVVGDDANLGIFIRWKHVGIKLKPSENRHQNLNFGGDVEIPLGDMVVNYYLHHNKIRVTPKRGGVRHRGLNSNLVAHPHILSRNEPCFGDFSGPVTEAMHDKDLETLGALMEMFLSQAAVGDPAGDLWYRWLDDNMGDYLVQDSLYTEDDTRYRFLRPNSGVRNIRKLFFYEDNTLIEATLSERDESPNFFKDYEIAREEYEQFQAES